MTGRPCTESAACTLPNVHCSYPECTKGRADRARSKPSGSAKIDAETRARETLGPKKAEMAQWAYDAQISLLAGQFRAVHFVGFRGDEYVRAVRVFGPPDFVHVSLDARVAGDVAPGDLVVFANGAEDRPSRFVRDDSRFF